MAKKSEIIVPHGAIKKIAQDTGFSAPTIRYALRGIIDTENANLIRKRARYFGGVVAKADNNK
ncbi:hypothetical protein [Phocaeicola sp.]